MKIAVIIIRTLMGLLFLFSSVVVLFQLVPTPELSGKVKLFNEGITASGYFIPMLKTIELVCAVFLLTGRLSGLVNVILFPITFNILAFHFFLAPEGLPVALFLFLGNIFLMYFNKEKYFPMLAVR